MPLFQYHNGVVVASRKLVCRVCGGTISLTTESHGRPETDAEHILVTLDRALADVAKVLRWSGIDEHNRANCPRHPSPKEG